MSEPSWEFRKSAELPAISKEGLIGNIMQAEKACILFCTAWVCSYFADCRS
jgi:hypothetical protein